MTPRTRHKMLSCSGEKHLSLLLISLSTFSATLYFVLHYISLSCFTFYVCLSFFLSFSLSLSFVLHILSNQQFSFFSFSFYSSSLSLSFYIISLSFYIISLSLYIISLSLFDVKQGCQFLLGTPTKKDFERMIQKLEEEELNVAINLFSGLVKPRQYYMKESLLPNVLFGRENVQSISIPGNGR